MIEEPGRPRMMERTMREYRRLAGDRLVTPSFSFGPIYSRSPLAGSREIP
jgi:hypothetical protein